jgi:DNA-directed RNA polymerase specialized sigma24 family protein
VDRDTRVALLERAREGDRAALHALCASVDRMACGAAFVLTRAARARRDIAIEDAVQEARIAMIEQLPAWDPARGRLGPYVFSAVRRQLQRALPRAVGVVTVPIHRRYPGHVSIHPDPEAGWAGFDIVTAPPRPSARGRYCVADLEESLRRGWRNKVGDGTVRNGVIAPADRDVFARRYGLLGNEPASIATICAEFGLTHGEAVEAIKRVSRALTRLRRCESCGKPFFSWFRARYCGEACADHGFYVRTLPPERRRPCARCGTPFETRNSTRIYCSDDCYTGAVRAKRKAALPPRPERTCVICGAKFRPEGKANNNKVQCSPECRREYRRRTMHPPKEVRDARRAALPPLRCRHCGAGYPRPNSPGGLPAYCSDECRRAADRSRHAGRAHRGPEPVDRAQAGG